MRQSQLFTKTRKEAPKDEVSKNAELLIRGGYINKEMAGVYSYLPLGLKTFNKIVEIIRNGMNAVGGQEVFLTTLQDSAVWEKSGRWDDKVVDNWFKTKLASGREVGIANTHEEPLADMLRQHVSSYSDLPIAIYQFQTKFRNELRAKSGIMRSREFIMKDLYSFSKNEEEFREFYERVAGAYMQIFDAVGLGDVTYRTLAAGGSFTTGLTDEFQTVSDAGEDTIFIDEKKRIAINKEVYTSENIVSAGLDKDSLKEKKSIEVGNIFPLGTKYSDAVGLSYKDQNGKKQPVVMGSYGLGPGRLMGTIVEVLSDEKGIVWPESVAPFAMHLVSIGESEEVRRYADSLYDVLIQKGIEVLYDDRGLRAGEKFADSDLLGIPVRVVISDKTLASGKYECVNRASGEQSMKGEEELLRGL
jgi:prolyl-tRNA synthetase